MFSVHHTIFRSENASSNLCDSYASIPVPLALSLLVGCIQFPANILTPDLTKGPAHSLALSKVLLRLFQLRKCK